MSYCLEFEVVVKIQTRFGAGHNDLIEQKVGLLHSALQRPLQEVFNIVIYKTLAERAAALLQGIALAHAFRDANKRTAWTACVFYLAS